MRNFIANTSMQNQKGAVLITALMFLVILTLLALTSMNTNTLEEKMAANSQEINRAFQTAETGLDLAMDDDDAFTTSNTADLDGTASDPYDKSMTNIGGYGADVDYNAVYRQKTRPPRGSQWDQSFALYHFDMSATGRTQSGATTTIHGGAYQVGPDS
jgi:hypothetical protein